MYDKLKKLLEEDSISELDITVRRIGTDVLKEVLIHAKVSSEVLEEQTKIDVPMGVVATITMSLLSKLIEKNKITIVRKEQDA